MLKEGIISINIIIIFFEGEITMKKVSKLTLALLCTAVLAGCTNSNNSNDSSSATKSTQTTVKSSSATTSSSATSSSASESTSSQASTSSAANTSTASSETQSDDDVTNNELVQYAAGVIRKNLGDSALVVTLSGAEDTTNKASVSYSGDINNYTTNYYLSTEAKDVNDESLQNLKPYATLTKKTYTSKEEAIEQIDYTTDQSNLGLSKVNLGYKIIATVENGAGQRYLHWNEGNWSLTMHGSPVAGEDPTTAAKTVVKLLERYSLPAPSDRGSARLETTEKSGTQNQTLTWNEENVVYQFSADTFEHLVVMAASLQ